MPEIDETQLAAFNNLQGFVQRALASPAHRSQLLKIQKDLYPDVPVPEIDAANPILEKLTALEQRIEEDRKAREEAAARATEESQKNEWEKRWTQGRKLLADRGITEEGVAAIEKMMTERQIADHEAALALYEKHNPPPPPALTGSSRFEWFKQEPGAPDVNLLLEKQDYDGFLGQAIDQARQQFRAAGGQG